MIVIKKSANLEKILETTGSINVPYRKVEQFGIFSIYVGLDGGKTDAASIHGSNLDASDRVRNRKG